MDKPAPSIEVVLVFLEGENAGSEIKIESPKELFIGRSEQCDIFIGEKKVSRKHAKMSVTAQGLFLEDLGSTNGSFVNGKKITKVQLKDGDSVRIGMSVFKVDVIMGKVLSEEGELLPDLKKDPRMTKEGPSFEIPLQDEGEFEKPFDIMSDAPDASQEIEEKIDISSQGGREERPAKMDAEVLQSRALNGKKPFSGDLSEMLLPDILQMIKNNKRSGVLNINKDNGNGEIYFVDGRLVGATFGEVSGLKAVYRMLSFDEGNFEFQALPKSFSTAKIKKKIEMSLENMLMEGMRQIDEFEKIRKGLPQLDSKLQINKGFTSPLSKLHPKVLEVLQLIINLETFSDVMDKSPLSDLETSKIIYYLLKKEYIVSR